MKYIYVVQVMSGCGYEDDTTHQPFNNYWDAVDAAVGEAREAAQNMRVVERAVAPEDEQVFIIEGEDR